MANETSTKIEISASPVSPPAGRRSAILDAACRAVERRGVRDLRVEDVADEADVSPALVYYYFGTRGSLIAETFRRSNERSAAVTDAKLGSTASARERAERILLLELTDDRAVRQNWIVWTEMLGAALFDDDVSALLAEETSSWVAAIERIVRDGLDDGSIRTAGPPGDVAERLVAILDGVGTHWMLGHMGTRRAKSLVRAAVRLELGETGR
jgi:AcrR family transcriptional regulator